MNASPPARPANPPVRPRPPVRRGLRAFKAVVFVLCLLPLAWIATTVLRGLAGPNPVEFMTRETGLWALILLLVTLTMTPLRRFTGWLWPTRLRRLLGLFAFFYVCLHFLIYGVFDRSLSLVGIADDVLNRPYILVGFLALVLLIPLAATSTDAIMRRMGRRWKSLHRLVYVCTALAVLHYLWQVRPGNFEPWIYAVLLAALMLLRLPAPSRWRKRPAAAANAAANVGPNVSKTPPRSAAPGTSPAPADALPGPLPEKKN